MKTVAVIPARYDSSRFPAKMLADLEGKPVILRTVERALKAESLDDVVVATDDRRIWDVVAAAGYRVCMTRKDHPSGTDRIVEAVQTLDVECVVNVQGDEPFMDPGLIDRLVARMQADDAPDVGTACTPITEGADLENPAVVKVVRNQQGCALYFSRSLIPFPRDEDAEDCLGRNLFFRHLGIYAYRRSFLERWESLDPHPLEMTEKLEQLRALAHGARIAVIDSDQTAPGIDTPEDLEAAITYLQSHPELTS
ncbi:3-deoxy-manno-octulosonate cytidylyltransferase [Kiritimatiellaeota bacterium B1221]|nr:3-deoxy-manno-octulosonate cytidylyltransferase [Kiritimatiellaeota bacterium B1221]